MYRTPGDLDRRQRAFDTGGVETDRKPPEPPENPEKCVAIDVGILKYAHDTDGTAVGSLDLSKERAQRELSRKEHGSNNWEKQRKVVAERHAELKNKRRDFLHKLSNYYAQEYDLVAVEDLDAKGLIELPGNSQNRAGSAWGRFLLMLEYNCEREGTHFVPVDPKDTTKECAACGVKTDKPLWVREHSCPACGFEADRDANAAWNDLSRGLEDVGVGYSESAPWRLCSLRMRAYLQSASSKREAIPPRSERRRPRASRRGAFTHPGPPRRTGPRGRRRIRARSRPERAFKSDGGTTL